MKKINNRIIKLMDIVIVLGCNRILDGGDKKNYTPRSHAYGRLMKTIEVFNSIKNKEKLVVCSGGYEQAERMKDFLIKRGLNTVNILCEPYSRTTIENCIFTYELLNNLILGRQKNSEYFEHAITDEVRIHLVTDDYHIKRAEVIFRFFLNRLKCKKTSIQCYGSFLISYLENPSEQDEKQIEESYINDSFTFIKYLDKQLKQYANWYPTSKHYTERSPKNLKNFAK